MGFNLPSVANVMERTVAAKQAPSPPYVQGGHPTPPRPTQSQYDQAAAMRTNRTTRGMKPQPGESAVRRSKSNSGPAMNQINWGRELEKQLAARGVKGEVTWKQSKAGGWRAVGPHGKLYKPPMADRTDVGFES